MLPIDVPFELLPVGAPYTPTRYPSGPSLIKQAGDAAPLNCLIWVYDEVCFLSQCPCPRIREGIELAMAGAVIRTGKGIWQVQSATTARQYVVQRSERDGAWRCSCPDHTRRGQWCKHLRAVAYDTLTRYWWMIHQPRHECFPKMVECALMLVEVQQ